ncbi:MAG: 50S ribosomal protein L6 [Candidatus Scalindua sp. AMX11]|nr:MAG: 50S ribosomal protein L6 [Candidatus Scalindua sp.]NOG85502.1 50S ribosomal protein L6 [Planctomycetota bacterium]RZV90249.1 MAG: 50S ribosomal protein L6 [Candidatus Scalindua sp. SCAELEC01]TDE64660.1 MAG: 50S ribosomal protein L6 [Candidatus Scalindua sp. AMX11]GJQ57503.1 MAG: 50S ribosomal protein L6 [Candidatus Scalindua sp.]
MSRIGNNPINIPDGVKVDLKKGKISVEGKNGKLFLTPHGLMKVELDKEKKQITVNRPSDERKSKELHGLTRTLLANNIHGVDVGFSKDLEIIGLGYSVKLQGNELVFQLGFSHPINMSVPEGIKIDIKNQTNPGRLTIFGADKQLVGQIAANIRSLRPPEPYKGKGVKYADEVIRRKAGKAVSSAK